MPDLTSPAVSQSSLVTLVPQLAQARFFTLALIGEFRYAVVYFDQETTPRLVPVGVPVAGSAASPVAYRIMA